MGFFSTGGGVVCVFSVGCSDCVGLSVGVDVGGVLLQAVNNSIKIAHIKAIYFFMLIVLPFKNIPIRCHATVKIISGFVL